MNDLSKTVAEILASPLAAPEQIASLIRQAEEELASLEAQLAETEGKTLAASTPEDEAEELGKLAASLSLKVKRRGLALDRLRDAHAKAVLAKAATEREEKRRRVMEERDQVAQELASRYPEMAADLAALLARVSDSEAACKGANMAGPEATVRSLGPNEIGRLTRGVILPAWDPRQDGVWPPAPVRSTVQVLPQAVMERSAQLGDMARQTMEANLRQEGRVRGVGPTPPEAELLPSARDVH